MLSVQLNIEYNLRIPDIYLKNHVYDQNIFYLSKSFNEEGSEWGYLSKVGRILSDRMLKQGGFGSKWDSDTVSKQGYGICHEVCLSKNIPTFA